MAIGLASTGEKNGMYGKKHRPESKGLMRENRSGVQGRPPGWHWTDPQIEKLKEGRKRFFENGGKSPHSKLYSGIAPDGKILFSKQHAQDILNIIGITDRQFRTIRVFCRRNPNKFHPIFNIMIIDEGKLYA